MWNEITPNKCEVKIGGLTVVLTCRYDWHGTRFTVTDRDGNQSEGEVFFSNKECKTNERARQKALAFAIEAHQARR